MHVVNPGTIRQVVGAELTLQKVLRYRVVNLLQRDGRRRKRFLQPMFQSIKAGFLGAQTETTYLASYSGPFLKNMVGREGCLEL
jgi:hypothetical protein